MKDSSGLFDVEEFLRALGAQRARLEALVSGNSPAGLMDMAQELETLSEELIVTDQELRAQAEELEEATRRTSRLAGQWQGMFAQAVTAYLLTDLGGIITNSNQAARRLLRDRADHPTLIRPIASQFVMRDRRAVRVLVGRAVSTGTPQQATARLAGDEGRPVPVDLQVSLFPLDDDDVALWWQLSPADSSNLAGHPLGVGVTAPVHPAPGSATGGAAPEHLLNQIVELTKFSAQAAPAASIGYQHQNGHFAALSVNDTLATACDEIQDALGEGPRVAAANERSAVYSADVTTDPRWPRLAEQSRAIEIRTVLACSFTTPWGRTGVVTLYSRIADAFSPATQLAAAALVRQGGLALGAVEQVETLQAGMGNREMIGQAVGILMERLKVTSDEAFSLLVRTSQTRNVKLRVVADQLVETGVTPVPRK